MSTKETRGPAQQVKVQQSPTRCPYCHEGVASDSEALVCADCLSRHHSPCWTEHGGCSSCQGERALEGAEAPQSGADRCGACGLQESASYECPCCKAPTCASCMRQRFRRCASCAEDIIRKEKRNQRLKSARKGWKGALEGSTLVSMVLVIAAIATGTNGHGAIAAGLFSLLIFPVPLLLIAAIKLPQLSKEIEALDDELAPFEESFVEKVRGGLAKIFGA